MLPAMVSGAHGCSVLGRALSCCWRPCGLSALNPTPGFPQLPASPLTLSSSLPFVLPVPKSQAGKDTQEGTVDTNVTLFPCCSVLYSETTADLAAASQPSPCSASSALRGPAEAGPAVPQGPGHYSIEICPTGLP